MDSNYICLRNSSLFTSFVDQNLDKYQIKLQNSQFNKGQTLFSPSESLKDIYIIRQGYIKLFKIINGKETIIDIFKPGDSFGLFERGEKFTAGLFAEALTNTSICKFSYDKFKQIIAENPDVAISVIENLSKQLQQSRTKITNLNSGNAEQKVYSELSRLAESVGKEKDVYTRLDIKLSHQQIADMIGLTRESVTHSISKLKKQDKLQIVDGYIEILTD